MGKVKTGALIVIEQDVALGEYENTGILIDAADRDFSGFLGYHDRHTVRHFTDTNRRTVSRSKCF